MTAVDDQLLLSENRATKSHEALYDQGSGTFAMVEAALAQRDATHALTLAIVEHGIPAKTSAVSVSKLAGAIRDGYRAAPSPIGFEEHIAKFVLNTLGIEAIA
jgi:hypothetical protein